MLYARSPATFHLLANMPGVDVRKEDGNQVDPTVRSNAREHVERLNDTAVAI